MSDPLDKIDDFLERARQRPGATALAIDAEDLTAIIDRLRAAERVVEAAKILWSESECSIGASDDFFRYDALDIALQNYDRVRAGK